MADADSSMPCPICAGRDTRPFAAARDWEYRTSDRDFRYDRCADCGSVFLNPPLADRLGEIYPPNYYSYQEEAGRGSIGERIKRRLDARLLRQLLRRLDGEHLRVLDVGGGAGWSLSLLRDLSPRVAETHEVDLDGGARAAAESAGHVFHRMRIEEFRADRPFDLILMLNLIEHVADPGSVLGSMRGALSPNGLLLIKTPNVRTFGARLFRHHNWGGFHCPRHFVLFHADSLKALAGRCGLRCDWLRYTQGGPQWASSVLANLAMRRWITITRDRPMHLHPLFMPMSMMFAGVDFLRLPLARTAQMLAVFRRAD